MVNPHVIMVYTTFNVLWILCANIFEGDWSDLVLGFSELASFWLLIQSPC